MSKNDSSRFKWHATEEISSADLVRECGRRFADRALWTKFQDRFQRLIFLYVLRAARNRGMDTSTQIVTDLTQDVYLRLVQHQGRILRSFRGTSDFSAMAFLARVALSVVTDHQRHDVASKRRADVVSIDELKQTSDESVTREEPSFDASSFAAILSWIDVERFIEADPDQRNSRRNLLIFKLHYIDGLTAAEIAAYPGFNIGQAGIEAVLARLRKRLRNER